MKKFKILAVCVLMIVSIATVSSYLNGVTIIIQSTGRGTSTIQPDGSYVFQCDNSTSTSCTLTVHIKPPVN